MGHIQPASVHLSGLADGGIELLRHFPGDCFSKATMTRLLNTLEEKGIILRDKSRVDWRSNYIRITRLGEKIRERANFIAMQTLKDSLRGLSRQEIFIAQKSLKTVLSNLNEMNRQKNVNEMEENIRKRREKLIRKLILHKK